MDIIIIGSSFGLEFEVFWVFFSLLCLSSENICPQHSSFETRLILLSLPSPKAIPVLLRFTVTLERVALVCGQRRKSKKDPFIYSTNIV